MPAPSVSTSLVVYLRDHRAGAAAGVRLAERCRDQAAGAERVELADLAAEIDDDRARLGAIMDGLGVRPSRLKTWGAAVAERVGRLKSNGSLVRRTPLAPLLEREALMAGVSTKRNLWRALAAADVAGVERETLQELEATADRQLERLAALHRAAAARVGADAADRDG